ncbi:MAG: prohibitin family protein [Methylococcales bacterium]|nr:prohibitin family protein [Methylococcales bacterium]
MKNIFLFVFLKKTIHFCIKIFSHFRHWVREKIAYFVVVFLAITLGFVFFWPQIVITIESGEAGVLYRRFFGTVTDRVFPEGIHVIYPWDTLTVYNLRIQTVLHEFNILTNQGLPITISLAIRYRPEYEMLGVLHQQVGPDYVQTIIIPQVESVLRKRLSLYDPEDIYTNKHNILTKVVVEALEELGRKYITTSGIIIRSIILPDSIKDAIEKKLIEEQAAKAYTFTLQKEEREAERKRIEARGIKDYQKIIAQTLSDQLIRWRGIQATLELAKSNNSKVIVIGAGKNGLPIILNDGPSSNAVNTNNKPEEIINPNSIPPIPPSTEKNQNNTDSEISFNPSEKASLKEDAN